MNIHPFVKSLSIAAPLAGAASWAVNEAYGGDIGKHAGLIGGGSVTFLGAVAAAQAIGGLTPLDSVMPARAMLGAGIGMMAGVIAADVAARLLKD